MSPVVPGKALLAVPVMIALAGLVAARRSRTGMSLPKPNRLQEPVVAFANAETSAV